MNIHSPNALVPLSGAELSTILAPELAKAAELARQEKAEATRRAYSSDFRIFEAWCRERSVSALPATAESVAAFLAAEVATDDERVKATVRGIRRSFGTAPHEKAPATASAAKRGPRYSK